MPIYIHLKYILLWIIGVWRWGVGTATFGGSGALCGLGLDFSVLDSWGSNFFATSGSFRTYPAVKS